MDWHVNRFDETFTYTKVSPATWVEQGTYDYITSGSIEMSMDSKYKVTGSFNFEGPEKPDPNYYMRVYYSFKEYNEKTGNYTEHTELLGTFMVSFSSLQYYDTVNGMMYSGSLNANSLLKILEDKKYGSPFVIKRNQNPIYKAAEIIKSVGLRVDYIPSSAVIATDRVFSGDTSYLDIVNWLCDFAKFREIFIDKYGVSRMAPSVNPENDSSPIVFRNDSQSIMYPEITEENDWMDRANVVKLIYNTDRAWAIAVAKNVSGTKISLNALGNREITLVEEIGDISAGKNIMDQLLKKAEEKLMEQGNEEEFVTFSHAYIPMELNKAVKIEYSDMEWLGNADNISINLQPGVQTQTKIKKTVKNSMVIEKSGSFSPRDDQGEA